MNSFNNVYSPDEIMPVVLKLANRYKGYESTSVSYDTVNMLMESVIYCINELGSSNTALAPSLSASEAFRLGQQVVLDKAKETLADYNVLLTVFDDYGLTVLRDTVIKGFPAFFRHYDPIFSPQNTILTLDYPIPSFDRSLSGIDAISDYLNQIIKEQNFLRSFPRDEIINKLLAYHPDYSFLIENITEMISFS